MFCYDRELPISADIRVEQWFEHGENGQSGRNDWHGSYLDISYHLDAMLTPDFQG